MSACSDREVNVLGPNRRFRRGPAAGREPPRARWASAPPPGASLTFPQLHCLLEGVVDGETDEEDEHDDGQSARRVDVESDAGHRAVYGERLDRRGDRGIVEESVADCCVLREEEDDEPAARDAEVRDLRERDVDVGTIRRIGMKMRR